MSSRVCGIWRRVVAGLVFGIVPLVAAAVPVKWTLTDVVFEDGGTATGYFIYDPDVGQFGTFGDFAVTVSGGNTSVFSSITYTKSNASVDGANQAHFFVAFSLTGSTRQLRFETSPALGNVAATSSFITGLQSYSVECYNCGPYRLITRGTLSGAPVSAPFTMTPGVSGNWYNPDQPGHGFQIEVLPGGVVTAFWFVFDNTGKPVWLNGVGTINGDRVTMNMSHFIGGHFPPHFVSSELNPQSWGTLTLVFSSCDTAQANWLASEPGFTVSGSLSLKRLTRISGVTCP